MRVNFESTDRKAEESGTLREYNRQNIRKIYPTGRRNLKKKTKLNFEKFLVSKERKTEKMSTEKKMPSNKKIKKSKTTNLANANTELHGGVGQELVMGKTNINVVN